MRELINITTYPTPHNNGNGGGRGVTYVTYNGSSGINNSSANSGRMNFNSVNGGEGQFTYILAQNGTIIKIDGDELNYNFGFIGELESNKIKTGQLKADDADIIKAYIGTLDSKKITTEYLTVTKQAHFFELIIDKVRAVGGQIILTPAQCLADVVIPRDSNKNPVNLYTSDGELVNNIADLLRQVKYFDVYFKSKNSENIEVANEWFADSTTHSHDQAFCQSFNIEAGTHQNVSNKYYWRQVYDLLPDKMVNLTTSQIANIGNSLTATNNIHVSLLPTTLGGSPNGMTWQAKAQSLKNIPATVQWTDISGTSNAINGLMKTDSTVLGIQITPTGSNSYYMTDKLQFQMYYTDADEGNFGSPEGMKVGVYYTDGTSEYFTNLTYDANNTTTLDLHPDNSIESIIVVCTEPVQWVKCHGIRLSNDINDSKSMDPETLQAIIRGDSVAQASIPEKGDSIVQLGYQPSGPDDPNAELAGYSRQSAIIIAAYHTPDTDLIAPSYAQYMGINDYDLKSHRGSYIDGIGAKFIGTHGGDISMCIVDDQGHTVTSMVLDQQGIHTEVNGLSGQVSQFEQTVEGFTATVQQYSEDVNGYSRQVSSFQQTVNGFTTQVASYTNTVSGYTTQVSSFQQTVNGFNTTVQQYSSDVDGYSRQVSSFNQTVNGFTQTVESFQNDVDGYSRQVSSLSQTVDGLTYFVEHTDFATQDWTMGKITASSTSISAIVTSNIAGKLLETGIDIENTTINLKANTINVTPSSGGDDEIAITVGDRNTYPHTLQTRRRISLWNANMYQSAILGAGSEGGFMKVGDYYGSQFEEIEAFIDAGKPTIKLTKGSNYIKIGVDDNGAFIKSNCWRKQDGNSLSGTRTGQFTAPDGDNDRRACFYPNV